MLDHYQVFASALRRDHEGRFSARVFSRIPSVHDKRKYKGCFRGSGIIPINPDSVLSRLDFNLRTPTPSAEAVELPKLWVPKTPNNPIEATCHTDYIKRRISGHQGSSLIAILAAMD